MSIQHYEYDLLDKLLNLHLHISSWKTRQHIAWRMKCFLLLQAAANCLGSCDRFIADRNLEQYSAHHCHCCSWQIWGFLSESRAAANSLGGCDRFMSERMRRVDRRCLRTTSHQLGGIFTPVCRSLSYSTDSHNCSCRQRNTLCESDINT